MNFHQELNDKLWTKDNELKPEVSDKLQEIADAFIEYLDISEDAVEDVVITGSCASYNYTQYSDIDLHLLVDFEKVHTDCPIVEGYLLSRKSEFNNNHDISIYGIPVEVYAESIDNENVHNGLYSLKKGEWVEFPKKLEPTDNDAAVKAKYLEIKQEAELCDDSEVAIALIDKIKKMRKSGLEKVGEFSTENLTFKKLRDTGIIGDLMAIKKKGIDKQLSLESYNESLQDDLKEAWDLIAEGMSHLAFDYNYAKFEKKFDKIREMKQPKAQLKRAKDLLLDIQGRLIDEQYDEYNEKVDALIFKKNKTVSEKLQVDLGEDPYGYEAYIKDGILRWICYNVDTEEIVDIFYSKEDAIDKARELNKNKSIKESFSTAKVTFDNGDVITTAINGTEEEIRNYYAIGKTFNLGQGEYDKMAKVVNVEVIADDGTIKEDINTLCDKIDTVNKELTDLMKKYNKEKEVVLTEHIYNKLNTSIKEALGD